MIKFKHTGNFNHTERFLSRRRTDYMPILHRVAQEGVAALSANTPVDTGVTASSWGYEIKTYKTRFTISWTNSHIDNGVPIAIILQYGHGTRNGGYVQGIDYINPAMKPVFEKMANELWAEVVK